MSEKNKPIKTKTLFLLVTYGILLFLGLQHFSDIKSIFVWVFAILKPVIFGICIAFIINLCLKLFREKVFCGMANSERAWERKLCPILSVLATTVLFIGLIALIVAFIIPQITTAIYTLIDKLPSSQEQLVTWIDEKLIAWNAPQFVIDKVHELDMDWDSLVKFFANLLDGKVETVLGTAFSATTSVLSTFTNFLLGLIIAVYIIAQKSRVVYVSHKLIELIVPDRYHSETFRILRLTNKSFANFLTGQIVEALIMGCLSTIGLTIFRFPFAVTIGAVTGITVLIPIIGAWIGGAIGALLIWVDSPDKLLWFLLFIFIMQQLEGQFIYPKVVGDSVGLPGLLVLIAVVLGGGLGGIIGIILAVPLFAMLYSLLKEAIDRHTKESGEEDHTDGTDTPADAMPSVPDELLPEPVTVPNVKQIPVAEKPKSNGKRRRKR